MLQIESLPGDKKQTYRLTLDELTKLQDGKISSADYMTHTLSHAADLAEATGRAPGRWNIFKPSQAELFKGYIGMSMSERSKGFFNDLGREFVGGGVDPAGKALETVYQSIISNNRSAATGFNSNITDTDPTNSITHHFREFLTFSNLPEQI